MLNLLRGPQLVPCLLPLVGLQQLLVKSLPELVVCGLPCVSLKVPPKGI